MSSEIKKIQDSMDQEYREKNCQAYQEKFLKEKAEQDEKWPTLTMEEKIVEDENRFMQEQFPPNEKDKDRETVTVRIKHAYDTWTWQSTAKGLGLVIEYQYFPAGHPEKSEYEGMIIIARTRTHFQNNATWKELNIQVDNARQRAKKAAEELKRKKAEPVMETTGKGKEWNVAGKYRISFPAVTENWSTHHELSMTIYMQKTPKGPRMFAEFDFGMLGGYMQFERQQSDNKTKAAKRDAKNPSSKRKRDDVECESDEGDFWDEECRSPTPEQFHLGSIATPSAEHSTWNYRWRGREEGEREIQLSSDQKLNKFKFLDPRGTKIEGTFKCEYFDESKFAGEKIEPEVACKIDISQQWGYLNERAWNRECITRW